MDKCPECGTYMLSFNRFVKEFRCLNNECGYTKSLTDIEVERELDRRDILSKLAESLKLRGY